MNKISVVIITFNEEKNIERCLKSVQDIADEIIVVDSFSTDRTKQICESFHNLKFIPHKWEGYSNSKNYGINSATNDLIFSIDADEVVSDELKKSINYFKQKELDVNVALTVNRLTNYCGKWIKHGGWYPDTKLRLWNRKIGKWQGEIHEIVVLDNKTTTPQLLDGDLLHYSIQSIEQHIDTINKFSTIAAQSKKAKGKKTNLLKILFKPIIKFIILYIIRLGFLDGYFGFVIAASSAYSTYLKEIKLNYLYKS